MRKAIIAVMLLAILLTGCSIFTSGNKRLKVDVVDGKVIAFEGEEPVKQSLKALVKGSVYETGEQVSVFGTCLDADDMPLPGTYAVLSSWYPNGTAFFANVSMTEIQTSYFVYTGTMNAVQGTYLTELTCHLNGSDMVARAFGEWQNPVWVSRIASTQGAVANLSAQLSNVSSNLTMQIGDLRVNMTDSFAITWQKIDNLSFNVSFNDTLINITEQLNYVAWVANNSVDRNDSLLAQLMYQMLNVGINTNLTLNWTELYIPARHNQPWELYVVVHNELGARMREPYVSCQLQSNNLQYQGFGNVTMDYFDTVTEFRSYLDQLDPGQNAQDYQIISPVQEAIIANGNLTGGFYYHAEVIRLPPFGELLWNITCDYNG